MDKDYYNWSEFHNRLFLEGRLVLNTGLRIGAGGADTATGPDISVVRDALGRPYIPGSSFKGVLRNVVERFARTVNRVPALWACEDPLALKNPYVGACVPSEGDGQEGRRMGKAKLLDDSRVNGQVDEQKFATALIEHTCTVCRLFGSPWLASKVRVRDLILDNETWLGRVELRHGVAIDRETRTAVKNHLYTFETVPAGAEFTFKLVAENVSDLELGLLLFGLRQIQQGSVALGGARSRGLGWVTLADGMTAGWVNAQNKAQFLEYVTEGKVGTLSPKDLEGYLSNLKTALAEAEGGD